jgi:glycerol-1-phosphate dehydrogenase [NAD(P)+]
VVTPLHFDPGRGAAFWQEIRSLDGYPPEEEVRLRLMLFESDAVRRLPEILARVGARPKGPLLVVMDETPMRRAGEDLKAFVLRFLHEAGWPAEAMVARADRTGQVHTDLVQIERVQARLMPGCAVLSVGSGTVTDIAKHACHRYEQAAGAAIPFVVFQTANSVSAYTSNMAPTLVDGVKRTLPSRYPDALVCDLETLRDAPYAMTAAGVGDLMAAGVSVADWYLAYRLGLDDSYTPLAESLMGPLGDTLLRLSQDIRSRELAAIASLAKLIALAGLAMSLSHATTPLSGHEHVMSHVLDMAAEGKGRPVAMHGAQVALAAQAMSAAYAFFLEAFDPAQVRDPAHVEDAEEAHKKVSRAFASIDSTGKVADKCWSDYAIKLETWRRQRNDAWPAAWPEIRGELARRVWPVQTMRAIIRSVGLPERFEDLEPPVECGQVRRAFLDAHWIRRRFTLGDLLHFAGWEREALWTRVWEGEGWAR